MGIRGGGGVSGASRLGGVSSLLALCAGVAACGSESGPVPELELGSIQSALTSSVPFRVKALDYTAFKDSDTLHNGNCGSGPVDAETTSDPNGGGCNVGWTKAGEWLDYSLQVSTARKV